MNRILTLALSPLLVALASCGTAATGESTPTAFATTEMGRFEEPWALAFLPGGQHALVTEKRGTLKLWRKDGPPLTVAGTPEVAYQGQGGLGDVVLAPDFATSGTIYLSWAEPGPGDTRGAAVGRARLVLGDGAGSAPRLDGLRVIWRQSPKVTGAGHYSHRLAFAPDGSSLFIASGDRQKMDPAQDPASDLGKIVRLPLDVAGQPAGPAEHYSLGHRNVLGLAFDPAGRLWDLEHGPRGGDELNLVEPGRNYGWPLVSQGDHYDGRAIPRHPARPDFAAPAISWNPVIAPGDFIFYTGDLFPAWKGRTLIAGLVSRGIVEVAAAPGEAREVARYDLGRRLREIDQHEDGSVWVLEDGSDARLLRLAPQ